MARRFRADADNQILAANVPSGDATACAFVMQSVNTATFSFPFGFDDNSTAANATNYYFETATDGKSMSISWRNTVAGSGTSATIVVMVPFWWYFMCLRRSGTTITGFIRRVGSGHWFRQSTTTSGIITPTRFLVGGDAAVFPGEFWNGRVAAPRLWDLALTDSEIFKESYQLAPATRRHRLVGAWLDQGYDTNGKARNLSNGTSVLEPGPPGIPRFNNQPTIFKRINALVVDDGSPWILNWQDDSEPNEEDVVDDSFRPFLVEDAPVVTDSSETRPQADLDADAGDEPDIEAQSITVEEVPQLVVELDPEVVEADDDPAGAQITVDAEASTLLADDALEEPEPDADTPAPLVEDALVVTADTGLELTEVSIEEEPDPGEDAPVALIEDAVVVALDLGLELTEGADDEPEFGDDAFIVVVLDDQTTLVLTEQDDEPELDTVTVDLSATQPDDPAPPGDIEPALLAWVDLEEFHPELEFGLEILIGPTDDPPAQTNYVWIHRARRRGNR